MSSRIAAMNSLKHTFRFSRTLAAMMLAVGWIVSGVPAASAQDASCLLSPDAAPPLETLSDSDVEHIRLELDLDPSRPPAAGVAQLTLRTATDDADSVRLVVPGTVVNAVRSQDLDESLPFRLIGPDTLVVDLSAIRDSAIVSRESITLDIRFEAAYGIQFENGFAWTIDPILLGGAWFPWSGSTSDRFTSELLVTVPGDYVVAASGAPLALRETEDGRTTYLSSSVEPHTADDVLFAAGPYLSSRSGYRVETMHQESMESNPGAVAIRALEYFESELEFTYPFGVLTLAVIPDGGSPISGNGLILVPEPLTEELASAHPRRGTLEIVDAVADQWLGAVVSAETSAELWLEKGLSAYLAAVFAQSEIAEETFEIAMRQWAEAYFDEQERYRRALTSTKAHHPMQLNDAHARAKGAWAAHILRHEIGDNAFWEALAFMVSSNPFESVTTEDFAIALEEAAGQRPDEFLNTWVHAPGHPEPVASYSMERDTLFVTVEQQQVAEGVPEVFELSLGVEVGTLSDTRRYDALLDDLRETVVITETAAPRFVVVDPDARYLMKTNMEQSLSAWIAQLRSASTPAGRLAAAEAVARRPGHPDVLLGLRTAASQEGNPYVKAAILDVIGRVSESDAAERALLAAYEDTSAVVRIAALRALTAYPGSPRVEELSLRAANEDADQHVQAAAVEALGRINSSEALNVARAALITPSHGGVIQIAGLRALGFISGADAAALDAARVHSGPEQPLPVRLEAIHLLENLSNDARQAENVLITLLESGNWRVRQAAVEALVRIGHVEAVQSYLEREPISWLRLLGRSMLDCR